MQVRSLVVFIVLLLPLPMVAPWPDSVATSTTTVFLPLAGKGFRTEQPRLLISALYYDTFQTGEPDEAFRIYNPHDVTAPLAGWRVTDGRRALTFPAGMTLGPYAELWCARRADSFALAFGMKSGCEYATDSDPAVPDLTGTAWQFANTGGRISLTDPESAYLDTLVYEGGDTGAPGWQGPAVTPYHPTGAFGEEGQILYRKLDQRTGLPVGDTDTRADWASDPDDMLDGRKAQYPGWDLERFYIPQVYTETARLEVFVAPDNGYAELRRLVEGARRSIRFEGYTFESTPLAEAVAARARAGVSVEMILESGPPGGVTDQQRWVVEQIAGAGGRVYYFRRDLAGNTGRRYTYQHAKIWLLDGTVALVGSENPSPGAFPDDDKADGTFGRRGVYLVTDAPSVVADLTALMDADIAPGVHRDVWPWDPADPALGAPPAGFVPSYASGGNTYPVQKPQPLITQGLFAFQVISAPEQSLRDQDSLLGLIATAGPGDTVLVEQLYEHTYWGAEDSNVQSDPNPRLLAYIAAARRGAVVRVVLDSHFDDQDLDNPRSNLRTVEYLRAVAQAEGLDLDARRRNPTGDGIHNKMVLAHIGDRGWAVIGSLNGGEVSSKLNREVSLKVASDEAYAYLADLFWYDWGMPAPDAARSSPR
jgi:cardiolipin synthase